MNKRLKKCLSIFILSFVILLTFTIISVAYSEAYPEYLDNYNCAFIECDCNLGNGTLVLPIKCRENVISQTKQGQFFNLSESTVNGYFILNNGTKYTVRGSSLENFKYSRQQGYQNIWQDITFKNILNTNIRFSFDNSNNIKENTVFPISEIDQVILTIAFLIIIGDFAVNIFNYFKQKKI